jgi:hypothetical protein
MEPSEILGIEDPVQIGKIDDLANATIVRFAKPVNQQRVFSRFGVEKAQELRRARRGHHLNAPAAALLLDELHEQVHPRGMDAVLDLLEEVEPGGVRVEQRREGGEESERAVRGAVGRYLAPPLLDELDQDAAGKILRKVEVDNVERREGSESLEKCRRVSKRSRIAAR